MSIQGISGGHNRPLEVSRQQQPTKPPTPETQVDRQKTREVFDRFIGTTFYGQMLKSMRQTVGKPAYFHGGRAEEVFQGQLDQILAEKMTEATGEQLSEPMFELFLMRRMK